MDGVFFESVQRKRNGRHGELGPCTGGLNRLGLFLGAPGRNCRTARCFRAGRARLAWDAKAIEKGFIHPTPIPLAWSRKKGTKNMTFFPFHQWMSTLAASVQYIPEARESMRWDFFP